MIAVMAGAEKSQDEVRHLVIVLGDQLDRRSAAFDGFDPKRDRVWMAEVQAEATRVPSSLPRIAVFIAAMRHFRAQLEAEGIVVDYRHGQSLETCLQHTLAANKPQEIGRAHV